MIKYYDKCPKCGEPNTGINGYFFLVDDMWVCLSCPFEEKMEGGEEK